MTEERRGTGRSWAMLEAIPRGKKAIVLVPSRGLADHIRTLANMIHGDKHRIEVQVAEPEVETARRFHGIRDPLYLDHYFVEQLTGDEFQTFQALPAWIEGRRLADTTEAP